MRTALGPNPGDMMIDVYDCNKTLLYSRCFRSGKAAYRFLDRLSKKKLAKVFVYRGWELTQEHGRWYED